jgi:C1A family cysteine protease
MEIDHDSSLSEFQPDSIPSRRCCAVSTFKPNGLGWIPDLPDLRDYTFQHAAVLGLLKQLKRKRRKKLPNRIDLTFDDEGVYFSPPEDQGPLNSSAAFAVLSLVEYFERRVRGHAFDGSKLFLYKVTRNRLHKRGRSSGDTGADLRSTLKTLVQFGAPPEGYWPYDEERFDEEPSEFLYNLARPLAGVCYFRLDAPNQDGARTWETVQSFLASGIPIAFGFSVPSSMARDADIPFRPNFDAVRGGQAAVAVGYEHDRFGPGQHGLLVRNSWGSLWGDNGNGWLPVSYVRNQLARDFWAVFSECWLSSTELSQPHVISPQRADL